jgi:ribosomal protein S18 acetylase RimI-like enzyme
VKFRAADTRSGTVYRFRHALSDPPEAPLWPTGFSVVSFQPSHHAALLHGMLEAAYRDGGGSVSGLADWWRTLTTDAEYQPGLVFLVARQNAAPVAAAICWTSAYVKDLVVARNARRQGLATCLLRHVFATFHARGASAVDLKVQATNDAAIALYRSLGMVRVETLRAGTGGEGP